MLAGVAVVPTAPLLVEGVNLTLPPDAEKVRMATRAAVASLPAADLTVVLGAGPDNVVFSPPTASLAAVGRPEITRDTGSAPPVPATSALPAARHGQPTPLSLAVLALLAPAVPLLGVAVRADLDFGQLADVGAALAAALTRSRVTVLAAGDLSAGLTPRSPLHVVPGAAEWDERVRSVADSGRLNGLARLGPEEAQRVGATGWAPLAALHGLLAAERVGLVVRHYSAPLGVGYLVAQGG